ncbi:hypothetical protein HY442_01610 [Candidatus Parcubacteria bacterium]|nr:hypothetical protein [Candidatus Parcubacteria bacterium]MBI4099209.1 hypothetical protein [Candidatus Parcubacteria bacterium]
MDFQKLLASAGLPASMDVVLVLFAFLAALFFGFAVGRKRLIVAILAAYLARVILEASPSLLGLQKVSGLKDETIFSIVMFGLIAAALFLLMGRSMTGTPLRFFRRDGSTVHILIFSVLLAGLLVNTAVRLAAPDALTALTPQLRQWFLAEPAHLAWTVLPIAAIAFLRRRHGE